ncbi:hypothetical protein JIN85_17050 [Luteolibacter pohnpeiensis]|uniref:Uncharacterized protein n=1 Tax=Luteolibacter pohnpeiensis TaxID=454153 RepID=A0A934SAW8_9BACT|nr:hypothetical protein [Luteolibacter pohnpeiensis]MBK1884131.1 hypothetical protein [Luteolibacter pohnpeiensis]
MPPKANSEELQGQTHLVRAVAATLEIKVPNAKEIRFRAALLRKAVSELSQVKPSLLIRLYESACKVDFPDPEIIAFREACQTHLGRHLELSAHRQTQSQP